MRAVLASVAVAAIAALSACERASPVSLRTTQGRLPNVLLITVDTLRADHLGCYAGGETLTPQMDRLAAEGVLFESASTPVPATLPALASLFSGRYPGAHPVRTNRGRLPPDVPLFAEALAAAGYSTAAYYGNALLEPRSGFHRGFQTYTSFVPLAGPADEQGARLAAGWLRDPLPEPWFLWVHFMDPHGPYDSAPLSWSEEAGGDDRLPDVVLPLSPTNYGLGLIPKYQRLGDLDHAREYRRRYRGEIRFTDAQIGRLFAALDERELWDRTLVVLTADHGESLGEHDYYFQHGWFVFEEALHVPLIVRPPGRGREGRRASDPVSLVDLAPTLLAGMQLGGLAGAEGRDVGAALEGKAPSPQTVFAVSAYLNQVSSARRGRWKLVHTPPPPAVVSGDPWAPFYGRAESFVLYDLASDAAETRGVAAAEAKEAAGLRADLLAWETRHDIPFGDRGEADIDPATRERLEALGYGP